MKAVGIIAEYNPFHSGHAYQIRKARELSGCRYVVVVMSPDFVQRGSVSLLDKFSRTEMALSSGADLVLEMPVFQASGSAEFFAEGGVALLSSLGVVEKLAFGCETAHPDILKKAASFFALSKDREPEEYRKKLQAKLKAGMTYPRARAEAYLECPGPSSPCGQEEPYLPDAEIRDALSMPNNILAIEYLKALERLESPIKPLFIRRVGEGYHGERTEPEDSPFVSASTIRRLLKEQESAQMQGILQGCALPEGALPEGALPEDALPDGALPDVSRRIIEDARRDRSLLFDSDLDLIMQAKLTELACQETRLLSPDGGSAAFPEVSSGGADIFSSYLDVSPDLSRRLAGCLDRYRSFDQFVSLVKTRQMTETRIRRCLIHILLGMRQDRAQQIRSIVPAPYARILGFRREASPLLHEIRKKSSVPLFSNLPDVLSEKEGRDMLGPEGREALLCTVYSSRVRNMLLQHKSGRLPVSEYRRRPLIL